LRWRLPTTRGCGALLAVAPRDGREPPFFDRRGRRRINCRRGQLELGRRRRAPPTRRLARDAALHERVRALVQRVAAVALDVLQREFPLPPRALGTVQVPTRLREVDVLVGPERAGRDVRRVRGIIT
ncbi:unnamed protein product, partial [Pelagomonas calceolata]